MDVFDLVSTLIPSFAGLVVATVVIVYLIGQNKTPTQPVAVPAPGGRYLPMGARGAPVSTWQARWFEGLDPLGTFGLVSIADGVLTFTMEETAGPQWRYPVREIRARHRGVIHFGRAATTLWLPDGREIGLTVSRDRINRWVNNDFKSLRHVREAHTFLAILGANGARILPG